jgi:hypothetical protein
MICDGQDLPPLYYFTYGEIIYLKKDPPAPGSHEKTASHVDGDSAPTKKTFHE